MNNKPFYITTTLPYVNADLHMGHALEFVRADTIARFHKKQGDDVFFNTGTDEHGMKIADKAASLGKDPQTFVNENFASFQESVRIFGLSEDIHYIRTTDEKHVAAAQEFWRRVAKNGFIYKKNYEAKYCVGCESVKTDSELVNGECPDHPGKKLELIQEENYFFKFSAFQKPLLDFYATHSDFIVPTFRYNEMRAFVMRGLEDFSISRLKSKMSWGVPVPDDEAHVMYVWFDALTNYISTLGWGTPDESLFQKYWIEGTPTQYCGKDNTRFQSVMWQAMLIAAGVPNSHQIVVNGFITAEGGVKMSKTLGNVVNPKDVVAEYSIDALRLFLLKEVASFEDSPFTKERFKDSYNANLANGLGNLASRTLTMAASLGGVLHCSESVAFPQEVHGFTLTETIESFTIEQYLNTTVIPGYLQGFASYDMTQSCAHIWELISLLDRVIARTEPFKLVKTDPARAEAILYDIVSGLVLIADLLEPLLPHTAQALHANLGTYDTLRPETFTVTKLLSPLFPRK